MNAKETDLKGVCKITGLSEMRVRNATRWGDLKSHLEPIKEGVKTEHRVYALADIQTWRAACGTHTKREDGRNKYTIHMTPDEYAKVQALLKTAKMELPLARANKVKATAE